METTRLKTYLMLFCLAISTASCTIKCNSSYNNVWKISGTNLSVAVAKKKPSSWKSNVERRMTLREDYSDKSGVQLAATDDRYSRVNVYQISEKLFHIQDAFQTYELNTETKSLKLTSAPIDAARRKFIGAFDDNENGNWRFIPASERGEIELGTQK